MSDEESDIPSDDDDQESINCAQGDRSDPKEEVDFAQGRLQLRLASLDHAQLTALLAHACLRDNELRTQADALLAVVSPVPDSAVDDVLTAPDIIVPLLSNQVFPV